MNLANGVESWRIPFADSALVAATSDGGVVITNSSGVARIDPSGNVTPDPDLTLYASQVPITLSYLGGPDGTVWASSTSAEVVSDMADVDTSGGEGISDWLTPRGDGNANRAATSAKFMDADTVNHCGGFDGNPGKHAPAILVVPVNGNNDVIVQVKGAWQNATFTSDTLSVTLNHTTPTGKNTPLTVSGGPTPVLARIKVKDANGKTLKVLRVAVKAAVSPVVLDLYALTDPNGTLVGNAPNNTDVMNELTAIFGKYAVPFVVNPISGISVHYDLNSNQQLDDPGRNNNNFAETTTIFNYINTNGGKPQSDHWVSYVPDISPHLVEGFTNHICGHLEYIRNNEDSTLNGQPWVTAHETGHSLCLGHNTSDSRALMWPNNQHKGYCRIHEKEWHVLNPTVGEDLPPSAADK